MSRPRPAEILAAVVDALEADAAITAIVAARIYNHVPQDQRLFPFLFVRLSRLAEWDTKTSDGFDLDVLVDAVSNHDGDKEALELGILVNDVLHNSNLTLPSGHQIVLFRYLSGDTPEPADTLSHRYNLIFHVLAS
jgi:hypothetical protein